MMGHSPTAHDISEPIVEFIGSFEAVATFRLSSCLEESHELIRSRLSHYSLLSSGREHMPDHQCNAVFIDVARTLGLGPWTMAFRVVLPASMPDIMRNLRAVQA